MLVAAAGLRPRPASEPMACCGRPVLLKPRSGSKSPVCSTLRSSSYTLVRGLSSRVAVLIGEWASGLATKSFFDSRKLPRSRVQASLSRRPGLGLGLG
eukprot:scaffold45858_cov63-Phaeocystis_antarctica.AAC.2